VLGGTWYFIPISGSEYAIGTFEKRKLWEKNGLALWAFPPEFKRDRVMSEEDRKNYARPERVCGINRAKYRNEIKTIFRRCVLW